MEVNFDDIAEVSTTIQRINRSCYHRSLILFTMFDQNVSLITSETDMTWSGWYSVLQEMLTLFVLLEFIVDKNPAFTGMIWVFWKKKKLYLILYLNLDYSAETFHTADAPGCCLHQTVTLVQPINNICWQILFKSLPWFSVKLPALMHIYTNTYKDNPFTSCSRSTWTGSSHLSLLIVRLALSSPPPPKKINSSVLLSQGDIKTGLLLTSTCKLDMWMVVIAGCCDGFFFIIGFWLTCWKLLHLL